MWKNRNRDYDKLSSLISELLKRYVSGRGLTVHPNANIISKELQSMSNDHIGEYEVLSILRLMKREKKESVESFEEIWTKVSKERDQREWTLFVPIDIKLPKRKIYLGSYFIEVSNPSKDLIKEGLPVYLHNQREKAKFDLSKYHLKFTTTELNIVLAWKSVEPFYNALIGLIDFIQNQNVFHYIGKNKRSHQKKPSYIIGLSSVGDYFHRVDEYSSKREKGKELDKVEKQQFKSIITLLKGDKPKGSIDELIIDALRLYHEAMASRYKDTVFIRLWQIAEAITLSENTGGKTDKVIARLKWHFNNEEIPGNNIDFTLQGLKKKRNTLVHKGIDEVDSDDINALKSLCDSAIEWLIKNRKKIENKNQLELFYEYRTISKKRIEDVSQIIKILNNR